MAIVVDFDPKRERPQAPCPCPFCTAVRRSNHRGLFLCGGRWRDERLVARLTRDAGRAA